MSLSTFDVAILGAGFTGTSLAIQLMPLLQARARVVLVGSPKAVARGVAYGTGDPCHLLNVRAARMSAVEDDPDHFVRWLLAATSGWRQSKSDLAESYLSRSRYGAYLGDTLAAAAAAACEQQNRLDIAEGTAVSLERREPGFEIRLATGRRIFAPVVALCLGHQPPDFPLAPEAIDDAARRAMIADPWSDHRLRAIPRDAGVLFIGTGLTMVDQVLTLRHGGHTGRLTAVSRHGLIPGGHLAARTDPVDMSWLAGNVPFGQLVRATIRLARPADSPDRDWRAIVDGMRLHVQEVWRGLEPADRRRFLRHLAPWWSVHRHRMAPAISAAIERLRRDGILEIRAARLNAVRQRNGRILAVLKPRSSPTILVEPFDWIINCSGPGRVRPGTLQPLLAGMVGRGLARPDPLGLGLDVSDDCAVIGRHGAAVDGLLALGPLTAGRFLEITAVPEIRKQCAAAAARIANLIAVRQPVTLHTASAERRSRA